MSESEPLITQCPRCQTRFRVTAEQLETANGRVRCGACLAVFQAREAWAETETSARESMPLQAVAVSDPRVDAAADSLAELLRDPMVETVSEDDAEVPETPRAKPAAATGARRPWPVSALLGCHMVAWALLAAGILALGFDTWSRDPVLRDVYEQLGDLVGVELPPFKDLEAIRFTVTSVAPRLGPPEPLAVEATLVNTASMRQRLPPLSVRFLEEGGGTVAEQHVLPADYLPTPRHSRTMTPDLPVGIALRLKDPGGRGGRLHGLDRMSDSGDGLRGVRRALLSVSNKSGVVAFGRGLVACGVEIVSTGGTASALAEAGVAVTDVSAVTGFPEIMDGRVKTLHPKIHGGILARRDVDAGVLAEHGIEGIDLVAVNLYPFEETVARPDCTLDLAVENIDIGGPAMLRAASKNHRDVLVVVDPDDYGAVLDVVARGGTTFDYRLRMALKAFRHTAAYENAIIRYLQTQT